MGGAAQFLVMEELQRGQLVASRSSGEFIGSGASGGFLAVVSPGAGSRYQQCLKSKT